MDSHRHLRVENGPGTQPLLTKEHDVKRLYVEPHGHVIEADNTESFSNTSRDNYLRQNPPTSTPVEITARTDEMQAPDLESFANTCSDLQNNTTQTDDISHAQLIAVGGFSKALQ